MCCLFQRPWRRHANDYRRQLGPVRIGRSEIHTARRGRTRLSSSQEDRASRYQGIYLYYVTCNLHADRVIVDCLSKHP